MGYALVAFNDLGLIVDRKTQHFVSEKFYRSIVKTLCHKIYD